MSSSDSASQQVQQEIKNPPYWVFIAAPCITLGIVLIAAIIAFAVQAKRIKAAREKKDKHESIRSFVLE